MPSPLIALAMTVGLFAAGGCQVKSNDEPQRRAGPTQADDSQTEPPGRHGGEAQ